MYPGDPDADPEMVYHCRCKLTSALVKYPRRNAMRRDNITGEVVPMQTYEEWYEGKKKKFSIDDNEQSFRSSVIDLNDSRQFHAQCGIISTHRVVIPNYEIYVSDKIQHLKPLQSKRVVQLLDDVYDILGKPTQNRPAIAIVSLSELNNQSLATYSSPENVVRIYEGLLRADKKKLSELQAEGVFPNDRRSTLLHEFIHWQDAQEYQRLYGKITNNDDVDAYIDWIRAKSKDALEKLAHEGYNIYEISDYASKMLQKSNLKFDETYTEYRTKQYLKR